LNQYVTLIRLRENQSPSSSSLRSPSQIIGDAVTKNGGKVLSAHAMLGYHDICVVTQFQEQENVFKAFAQIKLQQGWITETNSAEPLANFDTIYNEALRETSSRTASRS
jgi:hypothetical protein